MVDLSESIEFNIMGVNQNKKQIILTDTKRPYNHYINSLKYRYNKKNPYLPNFVISKNGEIIKIMNPENYSNYMNDINIDKDSIIVSLENLGWLNKNNLNNYYVNWIGDIYKGEVFEKKWRDKMYWDTYTKEQIEALVNLIIELNKNFKFGVECLWTNVRYNEVKTFKGIVSKSNFDFIYKDVNPSFDFKLLKKQLKND
jgi:hypothetical protein